MVSSTPEEEQRVIVTLPKALVDVLCELVEAGVGESANEIVRYALEYYLHAHFDLGEREWLFRDIPTQLVDPVLRIAAQSGAGEPEPAPVAEDEPLH